MGGDIDGEREAVDVIGRTEGDGSWHKIILPRRNAERRERSCNEAGF